MVLLVDDKELYLNDLHWIAELERFSRSLQLDSGMANSGAGEGANITREEWGQLTSLRVQLASSLELELGLVAPTWARIDPVDSGTRRVIEDGARILYDPRGTLAQLLRAIPSPQKAEGR
mgnify:CR=1 FL=1